MGLLTNFYFKLTLSWLSPSHGDISYYVSITIYMH